MSFADHRTTRPRPHGVLLAVPMRPPNTPFMRPVLTHVALHVRDLEANVRFYEQVCQLRCVHRRGNPDEPGAVAWLAEDGRERELILVLISGGPIRKVEGNDYGHLGFALDSREAVDRVAAEGERAGCLVWPPRDEPYPVGYYCGLKDPDGNFVEFSYGQPLGPGAGARDAEWLARALAIDPSWPGP